MFRLSKLLEKLEDKSEARFKNWFARNKAKLPMRVPAVIVGWYFYGMFLNSLRLGITSTFHTGEDEIKSIWVLNPFKNWGAVFTGFGIVTTLVIILIICLITKKGYIWFSGYKYTHDPRGFDILPDGTHGTSGFLTEKEMREFLELSPAGKTEGMILGKVKKHPDDPDAYALYAAHRMVAGTIITCSASARRAAASPEALSSRSSWAAPSAASPRLSRMPRESFLNAFLHISGSMASM